MSDNEKTMGKTPKRDGYRMPGEFEPHAGCILIWPERPGSWRNGAKEARMAFLNVIGAIAESELVYLAAKEKDFMQAKAAVEGLVAAKENLCPITVCVAETDDAWARDIAPTFVTKG